MDRTRPSERRARLAVAEFLLLTADTPWVSPSTPVPDLSEQPVNEMRAAIITVDGEAPLTVYYRRWYVDEQVDVIAVVR